MVDRHQGIVMEKGFFQETNLGGFAIIALIVGTIILLVGIVGFIAEFRGKVSAILAQASDSEIGGDDGTTFGFDTDDA